MAMSNLWNPGVLPSSYSRVCVCVRVCVCAPAAPWLQANSLPPSTPTPRFPAQPGPPRMIRDVAMAHTPQFRQSLWESSSVTFAAAWSTALTRGNYFVSWALYEYCSLIVLLWKSISFLTLKSRNKFSSFFKEITLTACAIFRQRNTLIKQGQSGNKGHTGLVKATRAFTWPHHHALHRSILLGVTSSCLAICILSTIAIHFLMNV